MKNLEDDNIDVKHVQSMPNLCISNIELVSLFNFIISISMYSFRI